MCQRLRRGIRLPERHLRLSARWRLLQRAVLHRLSNVRPDWLRIELPIPTPLRRRCLRLSRRDGALRR